MGGSENIICYDFILNKICENLSLNNISISDERLDEEVEKFVEELINEEIEPNEEDKIEEQAKNFILNLISELEEN